MPNPTLPLSAQTDSRTVTRVAEAVLPTRFGRFRVAAYQADGEPEAYLALCAGEISTAVPALVRLHSQCVTGDVLGSVRCDCGDQMEAALAYLAASAGGVLIYMPQEGRGIGLLNKIRAYALQDGGLDTVEANHALGFPADPRDYHVAALILRDLGIDRIRLLTNNPAKCAALETSGVHVVQRLPLLTPPNPQSLRYLETKRAKLGHLVLADDGAAGQEAAAIYAGPAPSPSTRLARGDPRAAPTLPSTPDAPQLHPPP